jgi:hypothetical protein
VHGVVLDLLGEFGIRLDHEAQVDEVPVRIHVPVGTGHVEIRLDEIPARVVPVDARDLDDSHPGEAVRPALAHRGDLAAADAGIADARPLHLHARLDHVAHGPDTHGLAGARDLELRAGDP